MLEIPAGKLEKGEEREEAAKRELQEETGYIASNLEFVTDMYDLQVFQVRNYQFILQISCLKVK